MPCLELEAPHPDPIDGSEGWLVMIGEGSDAQQTLRLLNDLWPDVDCPTTALCGRVGAPRGRGATSALPGL